MFHVKHPFARSANTGALRRSRAPRAPAREQPCRWHGREAQLPAHAPQPTGEEIFAAYAAGEPEACRALKKFARRVALGIIGLQSVLDVERVAIGGGISAADALLPAIQTELDDLFARCPVFPMLEPELVRCRYGNDANMIGALKLFFERNPA